MTSNVKVFEPSGTLDGIMGKKLRQEMQDILGESFDIILIDLQNIKFMDSAGLGSLVAMQKMVSQAQKKLYICSVNEQVKMLFNLTKLERVIKVFKDRQDFTHEVVSLP